MLSRALDIRLVPWSACCGSIIAGFGSSRTGPVEFNALSGMSKRETVEDVSDTDIPGLVNTLLQTGIAIGAIAVVVLPLLSSVVTRRRREAPPVWSSIPPAERFELVWLNICLWMAVGAVVVLLVIPSVLVVLYYLGNLSPGATALWLVWANVIGVVVLVMAVLRVVVPGWLTTAEVR